MDSYICQPDWFNFFGINPGADICPYYDRVILVYVPGHTQIWHNAGGTSYDEKNQGDVQP